MALNRMKLGELIEPVDIRNFDSVYTADDVMGISINKILINTKADLTGVNLRSYKELEKGQFAYCVVTSRNGDKISLAFNDQNDFIISAINPVFKIIDENILDPYYLLMFFKRSEFDRYSRFNSWGSARETFDWNDFCETHLDLPSIDIQKKYVAVYKAMLHNLEVYQEKLDDLKLVCDGYIEDLRRKFPCERIEKYITRTEIRNSDNAIKNVMGVSVYKLFREPTSKVNRDELKNYKVVKG